MNIHQEATPYIKYTKLTRTNFKFYFFIFSKCELETKGVIFKM